MALSIIRRICTRLIKWFDESDETMNQWKKEDPDNYYAFMAQQQYENFRKGF